MKAFKELFVTAVSALLALSGCATSPQSSHPHAAVFDVVDRNHDGKITRDEFIDWDIERLFKIYDRNHDGVVDLNEFRAIEGRNRDDRFRRIDRYHTGKITLEEAKSDPTIRAAMGAAFKGIDTKHQGYIDRQEWNAYVEKRDALVP
ncbi:MAG: EF-hand domain-containing protein, partial [Verrucomicrobia bacterium]|nr:EF-hand domain-containing protein [Verrucomicrobiota bacterium]